MVIQAAHGNTKQAQTAVQDGKGGKYGKKWNLDKLFNMFYLYSD
jgi:hypothetical protein